MSKSRWSKRWLYDPTVEVPRTTRWRRNIEFSDRTSDEEIDDIRGEFSSEVYEDLGKNTSPFKKRKLVDECLENETNDGQSSYNDDSQTTVGGQLLNCSQEDREFCRVEEEAVNCEERDQDSATRLTHVCDPYEMATTPDVWEDEISEGEVNGDRFDNFITEKVPEAFHFHDGPLLDELSLNHEIPDMDFFKETSSQSQEMDKDDSPLYQDSTLSVAESSLLVMAFAVRHKLSGIALEDMLELIHFHCPKPNNCITELKEFQLFFQALKHPILKHFYCPNMICKIYTGTSPPESGANCTVCGTLLSCSCYFIEIPILEQLKTILSWPDMLEKLQYRFQRAKIDSDAIEDVYDGELYKQHSCSGGFLSDPHSISFLGNTDGVTLIRSNGYGVWPVYLTVNEIPPLERFRRANRIFAGLWFGKGKPHFPTFLQPFSLAIRELYHKGVSVKDSVVIKGIFLDMSVDAPARSMWQAIKQFNGYCGCGRCKETGEHLDLGPGKKNSRRRCHVYPFNKAFAATTGHAGLRTHHEVKEQALEALRQRRQGKKNIVTAVSIIQKLPEIARSTTTSPEVQAFYEQLTSKRYNARSIKESIGENTHVVGSLERVWSNSTLLTEEQLSTLPMHRGKMWVFRRCLIDGILLHSKSYKRVIARNDYSVKFQHLDNMHYGSIHVYVKVEEKCQKALCNYQKCSCHLPCHYFAIVEVLDKDDEQLPTYRGRTVVTHITKVKTSNRLVAVPVVNIIRKYLKVDVSSGCYMCLLPNPYEKD